MNLKGRVPDFDLLVRQLVKQLGAVGACVRLNASPRCVQYWSNRKHLPPITKAERLAKRLGRSISYMRLSIAQARRKANGRGSKDGQ